MRDVALAHVKAMELPIAANKRFLITAGYFNNRVIVDLIRKHFPEYHSALPSESVEGGNYPEGGAFKTDNTRSIDVLGIKYKDFEDTVVIRSIRSKLHQNSRVMALKTLGT